MTNKQQLFDSARRVLDTAKAHLTEFERFLNELHNEANQPDDDQRCTLPHQQSRRTKIIRSLTSLSPGRLSSGEASGYLNEIIDRYIMLFNAFEPELCANRPRLVGIISGYLTHLIKKGYVGRECGIYYLTYAGKALPYT